jgi:hypothetical protein
MRLSTAPYITAVCRTGKCSAKIAAPEKEHETSNTLKHAAYCRITAGFVGHTVFDHPALPGRLTMQWVFLGMFRSI